MTGEDEYPLFTGTKNITLTIDFINQQRGMNRGISDKDTLF